MKGILHRRSFLARVSGFALLGGAASAVTGCVTTGYYTGATDADPVDAVGYGRSGITDADAGAYADPAGRGRGGRFTGVTDSDLGYNADPVGRGRGGRQAARGPGSASGFFISTDGYIVTNFHVVRDRTSIQIERNGVLHPARIVASDPANDLAILKADLPSVPLPIGSAREVRVGEEVIALGYPLASLQGQEMRASFGRVNALSSLNSDNRHLQIDAPVQPGSSGGPLIGPDGRVVGIVTARLDDLATLRATGALPQNVSFGLKIDYLAPLLPADVVLARTPLSGSMADRVEAARRSVVFVMVDGDARAGAEPEPKAPGAAQPDQTAPAQPTPEPAAALETSPAPAQTAPTPR